MQKNLKNSFWKTEHVNAVLILFLLLIISCSLPQDKLPLFTISEPVYKSSAEDSTCKTGGVYFDFYNKADSTVTFMEIRMNIFDPVSGKMAFTGTGTIVTRQAVSIAAGEIKHLCINLDSYITVSKESGYYIDQFYISRLEYSDGQVWKDYLGVYAVGQGD